ncbi:pollen-specific leucine-rich repeat extensin-like protein 1 isoform X2 [Catharus ustulatus]|uniref:pollen-specific leucine-rich repeat extensin-like protein 1 isoform X2 n=1 Tax=Catharus ustulatus TaxID=91951 RepID=UPI00140D5DAB|nr:pollen-specific leucine-rich repeat extensin-like protein 1 isoform X2 [Catharus ustulatus]
MLGPPPNAFPAPAHPRCGRGGARSRCGGGNPNPDVRWGGRCDGQRHRCGGGSRCAAPKTAQDDPKGPGNSRCGAEAPNPDVAHPKIGSQAFSVDSDTDVEEDPDVEPQKGLRMTQNVPESPDVETPNPDVGRPKPGHGTLVVDSDTDVEEDPDVQSQKRLRATRKVPGIPDVTAKAPNPDVPAPEIGSQALLEDSDTDVEDDANPDVHPKKGLRTTPKVPRIPDVEVETPNPDVPNPKIGSQALSVDSDTDVEEDPDVQPQKRLTITQNVLETPDVASKAPNPDVPGPGLHPPLVT